MSSHVELELAPAYALGSLDESERRAFEAHLPGCPECQAAVAAAAPVAGALGHATAREALPAGSADRLVALFRAEKASGLFQPARSDAPTSSAPSSASARAPAPPVRSSGFLIPAALAFVALGMGAAAFESNRALQATATEVSALLDENAKLHESLSIAERLRAAKERELEKARADLERCHQHGQELTKQSDELTKLFSDPRNNISKMKRTGTFTGDAEVAFDPRTRRVGISTAALPAAPEGKTYKLWAFVKGKAEPQDLLAFDPSKEGIHLDNAPEGAAGFAVSLEKDPNTKTPTEVVLVLLPG